MRIFITGGTGFIGKYLVEKLKRDRKNNLLLLSRNLADIKNWKKEVKKFKPEATIHLAWEGIPDYSAEISIKNLNYGLNLINFLAEIGCKSFLSTGSCWEYGQQSGKISEDMYPKPFNPFSAAKNALHLLGKEIAKENNIQFIWIRLFYVYGPGQKEESLIPYLINCIKKGEVPKIKNPSTQNDFVYVEDVAEAISLLVKNCKEGGVYNIGSGYLTKIQDILKIISPDFEIQRSERSSAPGFYADISKIKKEIGWKPKTNIEEGIQKMIDYSKIND